MTELQNKYFNTLLEQADKTGTQLFLVGGTVRDHILGAECADVDFTAKNVRAIAREFAKETQSTCVPLDKTPGRETFRVVIDNNFNFDFTEMQGNCIEEDLSQRDFTINAMAVPLKDFTAGTTNIVDPHDGKSDLKDKIVRVVPGPIFTADPLRMLRAFRFAATLKFAIEPETLKKIATTSARISETAPERIYYELILFLNAPRVFDFLNQMDQTGLLECILPAVAALRQTPAGQSNDWTLCLEAFKTLEDYLSSPESLSLVKEAEAIIAGRKSALLKLSCLLQGLDTRPPESKPSTQSASEESNTVSLLKSLRASNADIHFVFQTIQCQKEAITTRLNFAEEPINKSGLYQFVKKYDAELIPGLLLACVVSASLSEDQETENFLEATRRVSDFYFHRYLPSMKSDALLSGNDLIRQFQLSPSPLFRVILDRVEEGRVLGTITTRIEAEQVARNIINAQ